MKKLKNSFNKKDKGIALVFSLFFFVIFFAFGTALLFRSTLNKKTSNALTESQLNNASLEGAIGEVRANLVMANLNVNGSQKSSGTSLAFEGKMTKSTLDANRSPVYTISSQSSTSVNGSANNIVAKTTPELFKFDFNGIELTNGIDSTLTGAPSPEWNIHFSDPSKADGSGAIRYSYIIMDQTGKVNPNFGSSSVFKDSATVERQGFDSEIYKEALSPDSEKASAIYDLSGLFTTITDRDEAATSFTLNRFNSISQLSSIITSGPPSNVSNFKSTNGIGVLDENRNEISMSSERLALENLYPYSHPVTYAPKSNIFNLAYLDSTAFKALSNEQKVETLIGDSSAHPDNTYTGSTGAIPYIANMPSLEYDETKPEQTTAQKEQIAASMIDMVDDDIFTTSNLGFYPGDPTIHPDDPSYDPQAPPGRPWSWKDWLANTNNRPYAGFEGISVNQIGFFLTTFGHSQVSGSLFWGRTNKNSLVDGDSNASKLTSIIKTNVEPSCAYDLNGTSLMSLIDPSFRDSNGQIRLMTYMRIKVSYDLLEETTRPTAVNLADGSRDWSKAYTNIDPIGASKSAAGKAGVDSKGNALPATPGRVNGYTMELVGWLPDTNSLGRWPSLTGRPNTLLWSPKADYDNFEGKRNSKAKTNSYNVKNFWMDWACYLHSSHKMDEDNPYCPNFEDDYHPIASGVKIEVDSPIIIFVDSPNGQGGFNNIPEPGEIISITTPTLPDQDNPDNVGYSQSAYAINSHSAYLKSIEDPSLPGSGDNRDIMTTMMYGDPRMSHLPNSSVPLGDPNAPDNGWIYSYHTTRYASGELSSVHLANDHFRTWTYDGLSANDQAILNRPGHIYPSKEELNFTFPKTDNEVVLPKTIMNYDEKPVSSVFATTLSQAIDETNYIPNRQIGSASNPSDTGYDNPGIKSVSSLSLPLRYDDNGTLTGFGGLDQLADIGKICRGEHWRTFNLCQYNVGLIENPGDTSRYSFAGVKSTSYTEGFDATQSTTPANGVTRDMLFPYYRIDLSSSEFVDDLITDYAETSKVGGLLNGGDAALLDELGFDETNKDNSTINLPQKTIYGAFNPNTTHPLSFQSFISGIKINRFRFSTRSYRKGDVESEDNPALPVWKSAALASNFYKLITDNLNDTNNNRAPFDRKYSFSNTLGKSPGDTAYQEGFNISSQYDPITRSYMNGELRTGSFRWGNVFANEQNLFLVDSEREALYTNTREFISIRYNYYTAILLIEPLKMVPDAATGTGIVTINSSGDKAKIESHYRVRAELAHDILTNQVKVMSYSILN